MNVSETAFVTRSDVANFKVRFFTPAREVNLCGHATIGTFFSLVEENILKLFDENITVTQETRAGILPVEIKSKNGILQNIMMTQSQPQFRDVEFTLREIADILNIPAEQIESTNCPVAIAYTGLWHIIVPVKNIDYIKTMQPDFKRMKELNLKYGINTTHVFSFETVEEGSTVHTRDFAPAVGIDEDPATGTGNGALGAYLVKYNILKPEDGILKLTAEQGFEIGRDSKLFIEVHMNENEIDKVKVGGLAVTSLNGTMYLG